MFYLICMRALRAVVKLIYGLISVADVYINLVQLPLQPLHSSATFKNKLQDDVSGVL